MRLNIAMCNAVLPTVERGGVAYQVHGLANALTDRGHSVTVFTQSAKGDDARYAVERLGTGRRVPRILRSYAQAVFLTRSDLQRFDVVHAHGDNYLLGNINRQVRTFHGSAKDELRFAVRPVMKVYYATIVPLETLGSLVSGWNVAVSTGTRARIRRIDEIIPCGVETQVFSPGPKSDVPSILFVGGLDGRKRGAQLVEAFLTSVRPAIPNAELWLVSSDTVDAQGVRCFGRVDESRLAQLYASAWAFSMPSAYEGFGVPYVEAMASGTTVIATDNPGAREVLSNGEFGVMCHIDTLGAAMIAVLEDEALRNQFAVRGVERAKKYAWANVARAYEVAYRGVMDRDLDFVKRLSRKPAIDP